MRRELLRESFNEIEGVSEMCYTCTYMHIIMHTSHVHVHACTYMRTSCCVQEFKIATSMDTSSVEDIQEFLEDSIKGM